MGSFIRDNPVWVMAMLDALAAAILNVVLVFGFELTAEQIAAINGVVLVVAALALGLFTQKPVERLVERRTAEAIARMSRP